MKSKCHSKKSQQTKQQIRTYIRLFPSNGIDTILQSQYQIIDGKSFLDKRINNKYIVHTFNYIYTNQFAYSQQIQHMNIIDDCFQGKNQVIIAEIDKQNTMNFMLGNSEDPGFVISLFHGLFNQTIYINQKQNDKTIQLNVQNENILNKIQQQKKQSKKQQNISISIFASQNNSNKFIDLILGQRFQFYSKKDMDDYKDFYNKDIQSMRQFLIVLKIALVHYQQCCKDNDPITIRIIINFYDQIKNQNIRTTLHLVLCEKDSKVANNIIHKIQFSLKNSHLRGQDHGSMANYLQREIKKSKLIYIYGIPYRKSVLEKSVPLFQILSQFKNQYFQFQNTQKNLKIHETIDKLNNSSLLKTKLNSHNFTHKQINTAIKLLQKLCVFLSDTQTKWKNYCQIFQQVLAYQKDFYERQRFPISLQIQQYNVKAFLISKIYKLSQTYQMDDLTIQMQKLRTIKNQISISYKAILNSKQYINLLSNAHATQFMSYYGKCIQWIGEKIKQIFGFRYRQIQIYKIDMKNDIKIQIFFDSKILKQLINRYKNQAKKIKQKQQVYLRQIDIQNINPIPLNLMPTTSISKQQTAREQLTQRLPNSINLDKSFEIFRKLRAKRQQNLSQLPNTFNFKYQTSRVHSQINNSSIETKNTNNKYLYQDFKFQNNSIVINKDKQNNYNFCLPKIAIIRRKKK